MAKKLNQECIICGKAYAYCPNCRSKAGVETWRNLFCSEDCKTVYEVVVDFRDGKISAPDAKEALAGIDTTKVEDSFKPFISQIMSANVKETTDDKEKKPFIKKA